jgi:hypothetical protein
VSTELLVAVVGASGTLVGAVVYAVVAYLRADRDDDRSEWQAWRDESQADRAAWRAILESRAEAAEASAAESLRLVRDARAARLQAEADRAAERERYLAERSTSGTLRQELLGITEERDDLREELGRLRARVDELERWRASADDCLRRCQHEPDCGLQGAEWHGS